VKRASPICLSISLTLIAGPVHAAPAKSEPVAASEPAPTTPASPTAAELSDQAIERFKAKDYDTAANLFEQAHALDPNPNYLFNIGRVYEEKGDINRAVEFYQRFVKEPGVQIESRDLAVQRLRVLKAILQETDQKPDTKPDDGKPVEQAPDEPQAKPEVTDADPHRGMRLAGYGLLGVGGLSMILGGVFGGLALAKKNDLDGTALAMERRDLTTSGKTFALVSDVTLFSGIGIAATGLVLVLVARSRTKAARSAFAPSFGRGHAGVVWSLRF
jgi:tetratricopeptide (TPR) repeat protein